MFSQQAFILTICNVIILVAVILSMFVLKKSQATDPSKVKTILKNISVLVMFIIIMLLQVYSLNCMVYGNCQLWSWILTSFAIFGTLGYIGFFAYLSMSANQVKSSLKDIIKPDNMTSTTTMTPLP